MTLTVFVSLLCCVQQGESSGSDRKPGSTGCNGLVCQCLALDFSHLVLSVRLFAHQEDADIDDPYTAPQGHALGEAGTD